MSHETRITLVRCWPDDIHRVLTAAGVRQVGYVPDSGHARLIESGARGQAHARRPAHDGGGRRRRCRRRLARRRAQRAADAVERRRQLHQHARHGRRSAAFRCSCSSPCAASGASSTRGRCRCRRLPCRRSTAIGVVVQDGGSSRRGRRNRSGRGPARVQHLPRGRRSDLAARRRSQTIQVTA